jgi:3-deoxy-D-manno-octulosonic-acid transferase
MPTNLIPKTAFGVYNLAWRIALPWLRFHHRLAAGYQERTLRGRPPQTADLWIQAASVGESYLAQEVIRTLETKFPLRVLLTSNTRQGIEILTDGCLRLIKNKKRIQADVRFFPFDQPAIMATAVAGIRPKLMVLMETEIWPGLLRALKTQGCQIAIINGRITPRSLQRYLLWPSIWQALRPDKILAISAGDAERFRQLFGPNGIEVMANIKYDRITPPNANEANEKEIKAMVPAGVAFVVLASVRREEESQVKKIIHEVLDRRPKTVIGLFPRHIQRIEFWQDALTHMQVKWSLRSTASQPVPAGNVIIWDSFGELMSAYRLAQSAFVGGSLAPLGGQNFLEALVSGIIPVSGPSWENFAWVGREIIDSGLLRIAGDWQEVAALILKDLDSAPSRDRIIAAALRFITARRGGTAQACRFIESVLFEKSG